MARLDQSSQYQSTEPLPVHWKVRAVVGFAAGIFIATLLATFSTDTRGALGSWWAAAMAFAVLAWAAVAASEWLGRTVLGKLGMGSGGVPRPLVFLGLFGAALGLVALLGVLLPVAPLGLLLTSLPFVLAVALFWHNAGKVSTAGIVTAGVVLFLICVRLFTLVDTREVMEPALSQAEEGDVLLMSWNVGSGAPFFGGGDEDDVAAVASTVKKHGAHVVCLQEVDAKFVEKLGKSLGKGWRYYIPGSGSASTAVLSRIGGVLEAESIGEMTVVKIASDKGELQFVSCQAPGGRASGARRNLIDRVLNKVRDSNRKTVVAGDFRIDPGGGWTFLAPMISDAHSFDRASWRALNVLGYDPGTGGRGTTRLGRRSDWVVVGSKMDVTGYDVLESAKVGSMDHRPLFVRVGLGKVGRRPVLETFAKGGEADEDGAEERGEKP